MSTAPAPVSDRIVSLEPWFATLLLTAAVIGMAPLNITLGIGALVVANRLYRGDIRSDINRPIFFLLAGICVYLATRVMTVIVSPEPLVSLRHLAKDWRLVGLAWGMTGTLAFVRRHAWLPMSVMVVAIIITRLDFAGVDLGPLTNSGQFYGKRSAGFYDVPSTFSGVMALLLFVPAIVQLHRKQSWLFIGLCLLLLLAGAGRGYILGAILGGITWHILSRRPIRYLVFAGLVLTIVVVALPNTRGRLRLLPKQIAQEGGSLYIRKLLWQESLEVGRLRLLGIGPGRFQEVVRPRILEKYGGETGSRKSTTVHAHNNFLHAWATGGLVGIVGMVCLFAGLLAGCYNRNQGLDPPGTALWILMFASGMFDLSIYDGEVAIVFLFCWATVSGARETEYVNSVHEHILQSSKQPVQPRKIF